MTLAGYPDFLRVAEGTQIPVLEVSTTVGLGSTDFGPVFLGNATALAVTYATGPEIQFRLNWTGGGVFGSPTFQEDWHLRATSRAEFATAVMGRFVTVNVQNNNVAGAIEITLIPTITAVVPGGWNPGAPLATVTYQALAAGVSLVVDFNRPYRGLAALFGYNEGMLTSYEIQSRVASGTNRASSGFSLPAAGNQEDTRLVVIPPLINRLAITNRGAGGTNIQADVVPVPFG